MLVRGARNVLGSPEEIFGQKTMVMYNLIQHSVK